MEDLGEVTWDKSHVPEWGRSKPARCYLCKSLRRRVQSSVKMFSEIKCGKEKELRVVLARGWVRKTVVRGLLWRETKWSEIRWCWRSHNCGNILKTTMKDDFYGMWIISQFKKTEWKEKQRIQIYMNMCIHEIRHMSTHHHWGMCM